MIYLDNNASTQSDPEVVAVVGEATRLFGNPSSLHAEGRRARRAIEEARDEVASLFQATSEEIVFTSGATESNALAIFGAWADPGRIVTSGAEHPSVAEPIAELVRRGGAESVVVDPEPSGILDAERFLSAVTPGTALVSLMAANNEYGAIFPVAQAAPGIKGRGAVFHTDAVQAAGRISIDVRVWGVDLLSCSAHKMHGPKGVGALFVKKGTRLRPHTPGGGQEFRLRAGTENTAAIVGFGKAAQLARERLAESAEVGRLRDRFETLVGERISGARILGALAPRLSNTSAVLFEGVSGEALVARLDLEGIAVSTGSACSSGTTRPSPAVLSLGIAPEMARSVLRFSLSRQTRAEEIEQVGALLPGFVAEARRTPALVH